MGLPEYHGNLHIKMESYNQNKSIKDRAAYFMLKSLEEQNILNDEVEIVESTSGNLGLSLSFFANILEIKFSCLVDPTIMQEKRLRLMSMGSNLVDVECDAMDKDYRCARIRIAKEMVQRKNVIWTNQYANPGNTEAHYQTTGPEIWNQMKEKVDYVICAMGSGGTISGISRYMKELHPTVQIIGVEPYGSTIFGEVECPYLSVGAGLVGKSEILQRSCSLIDYSYVVHDEDAIYECKQLMDKQYISVGITTGMSVHIARQILKQNPGKNVVVVSADSADNYMNLLKEI